MSTVHRYTRDGDRVEVDEAATARTATVIQLPLTREHNCVNGWLGAIDRPAPCPTCRPATAQRIREQRAQVGRMTGPEWPPLEAHVAGLRAAAADLTDGELQAIIAWHEAVLAHLDHDDLGLSVFHDQTKLALQVVVTHRRWLREELDAAVSA